MTSTPEELADRSRELWLAGEREQASAMLEQAVQAKAAELPAGVRLPPQPLADHFGKVIFVGGPPAVFEEVGRESLVTLLRHGMYPHSTILDVGAASMRLGFWLINFLQPGCYFGLDPDELRVRFGLEQIVGSDVVEAKRPTFDHNGTFDFTVFGRKFDFFVARSIWTHTSKAMIRTMLDGFVATANERAVFLASYVPASEGDGYTGDDWVEMPLVEHSFAWVARECEQRGLAVRQLPEVVNDQPWLCIERAREGLPAGGAEEAQAKSGGLLGYFRR
jgi:hypothetical protein